MYRVDYRRPTLAACVGSIDYKYVVDGLFIYDREFGMRKSLYAQVWFFVIAHLPHSLVTG